jgi:plastocyanin
VAGFAVDLPAAEGTEAKNMGAVGRSLLASGLALVLAALGPPEVGSAGAQSSDTVELTMSNFRYCAAASCTPADQGYVRTKSGPVAGSDNPGAVVDVPEGAAVRWIYRDTGPGSCDSFAQCPGHNVVVDDGSAEGANLGFTRARRGEATIVTTINQPAGTVIRYYCSVNDHYQLGMTGVLRVTARTG